MLCFASSTFMVSLNLQFIYTLKSSQMSYGTEVVDLLKVNIRDLAHAGN